MARTSRGKWEVTAVAPEFFHGDLRPITLERHAREFSEVVPVPVHFSKQIHLMLYAPQLRRTLKQKWDMIHCWEEPFVFAGGQIAKWAPPSTPLVFATFQNIAKRYPPPFNWIERYSMRRAAAWIAFGKTVHDNLEAQGIYSSRSSRIIPPGVDVEHFHPNPANRKATLRKLDWSSAGPPVIGYLGRFVKEKGIELLTRTLDQLSGRWRALFVGSGPMESALKLWANRYGERVKVLTGIAHDQVPGFLNAMDMLCAPSQTMPHWREQLGRMLIEAFACGVPVIASDSGEIPYVVGDAGIIVGEDDERGWLRSLERLLEDSTLRGELAARGLERAHSTYAWSVVARQHLDFFGELLDSRKD